MSKFKWEEDELWAFAHGLLIGACLYETIRRYFL